ncbi:dihydrofolate reductase [Enterococcus sp. 669A]|uniref:Dihydrofolate reductase n=1 Tax=Candidatus Enterococcus moelleringii TaxID=2815325 RepID=A0ABS3LAW3_9ENTE|nr:dihydrofolate reductase [Enterococcus sp. 669A]MBO1306775.1 dihydrofolate reductase [Enterococcus sp. 669A]
MLIAIWAQDKNGLIGKNDRLPWHLPNDLRFFREKTVNNTLVMGRKTFEGMGGRPLPNRQTIVLTKNTAYQNDQVLVMHSVEEVIAHSKKTETITYIAGGSAVYEAFLPHCDELYRTVIDHSFEGDTYFPAVDWNEWQLVQQIAGTMDEKNQYPHVFETFKNNKDRAE